MGNTILLNQLFTGGYLSEGANIGHETINMFKADNGQNYLYITPSGNVRYPKNVKSVLFVRNYSKRTTIEVVAIAPRVEPFDPNEISKVSYSGIPIQVIFGNNIYKGAKEDLETQVTFKATDGVFVPKKQVLLTMESEKDFPDERAPKDAVLVRLDVKEHKTLINQSMRAYYSLNDERAAYGALEDLLNQVNLWKRLDRAFDGKASERRQPSFLEIVGKTSSELIYSNLLAYYLRYSKEGFEKFSEEVLHVSDMQGDYSVVRESKGNIDIWIEDDKNIIVIENKVKSGIGLFGNDNPQLKKYYEYAMKQAEANHRSAHFFVFAPEYNQIQLDAYECGDKYTLVTYGELYGFFSKNKSFYEDDLYFGEFLTDLELHAKTLAELNYEIMRSRFSERIANVERNGGKD